MKKVSDRVASRVAKLTLGVGLIAAILCPFAGAGLAAWSTGAAALASLGTAAAIPLAGAGMVGGFVLGSIAAPFVAIGSVLAAGVTGGVTKAVGSLVEWMAAGSKAASAAPQPKHVDTQARMDINPAGSKLNGMKLATLFAKTQKSANENKPQPQHKKAFRFGM